MIKRPRRNRMNQAIRDMVHETDINRSDLMYPVFVIEGENIKEEIPSMPGIYRYSQDRLPEALDMVLESGVKSIMYFGIPARKDELGSGAYQDTGVVQRAIRFTKTYAPELIVAADICLCEYTSHGHCGVLIDGRVDNDKTLELLAKAALSCARAGADMVAPSDMMDGRVGMIRTVLDENGFSDVLIMAYSVKYASAFYGPFRDAADSAPAFGDRKSYQMDFRNRREAVMEARLDIEEGADIVMVKPALAYLDIVRDIREEILEPLAVYHVSGEYAMIKAAAGNGWIDEKRVVMEAMTAIKRAGAQIIITYYALDVAKWIKEQSE